MSFNISLRNKVFFIFAFVIIFSITAVCLYAYRTASEAYSNSAFELSKEITTSLNLEIDGVIASIPKDSVYLANLYSLEQYIIWTKMHEDSTAREWKNKYSRTLLDFLEKKENFFKARIIDIDGNELISARYDKKTDKAFLQPEKMLQNKRGKSYFEVTKKLKKYNFYVSEMNLNTEFAEIEKPYIPVIRYATPIVDENREVNGIFVASIYADTVLDIFRTISKLHKDEGKEYFLIDMNGNYLYHRDASKQWNAQLKHRANFNKDHFNIKDKFKKNDSGVFMHNNKIYSYSLVHTIHGYSSNSENNWYIVSSIDEGIALSKLENFKLLFTMVVLFVLLVSFFIVRVYVEKLIRPMIKVTQQLNALSRGEIKRETIDYKANDEIGQIINSSKILVDAFETTMYQADAIANGDFSREIRLLSKDDKLGLAIQDMTKRLKEIATLARSLSVGNYDVHILPKGSDDTLGIALFDMVKYLKNVTDIAEAISKGNVDFKYKTKGPDDRLGQAISEMMKYLKTILKQANAISQDDFSNKIEAKSNNDELSMALIKMTNTLSENNVKNKNEIYYSDGIREFNDALAGINDTVELADQAIAICSRYVDASSGVVYVVDKDNKNLNLIASFAFSNDNGMSSKFKMGEGVVGQVALEKKPILLVNIQDIEYKVKSGTTVAKPKEIYLFPLVHEDKLLAVIEIMSFNKFTDLHKEYLNKVASIFAVELYTSKQNLHIKELLEKSQQSFEELQVQSEELQESNVQMEEQQLQLTTQSQELKDKNENLAQAKKEIDARAQELEKASKYKNEFLANMSHELRTPLNSIILLSKLLSMNSDENLGEENVKKASVINKAGNELLLLINDILDLSKIESGNMEMDINAVSSADIIDDLRGLFEPIAEEKDIDFVIDDSFNDTFMTDKTKLEQVLKNLLSNSFKFTKHGSVTLEMYATDTQMIISVEDTGIGIPSNKLSTIFEAFKQVDGTISREFGGTGLGLSISKTMIEHLNGNIDVQSSFGYGTKFTVALSLNYQSTAMKVLEHVEHNTPASEKVSVAITDDDISFDENEFTGKNILIVDDDSRNIFTLTSILENMNAEVYSAFDGKEAIEVLENGKKIDIIFMDIMMPVMDGLTTIKNIKANKKFKDIPIIAITAKTMPKDKQDCLDAGASDYLPKPLSHSALISMIKAWIR